MMRRPSRLAAACALAVASMALAGSAVAGGGNSANAPGQQKQDQTAAQPQQQAPHAQQPQHAQQSQQQAGVKPSSDTKHWTHTTVGANPDASKRYGNGKTAAEIAKGRGAPDSQPLTGPGNSQPHKTFDCKHKSNRSGGVDVHAIKSYSPSGCAVTAQQPVEQKHVKQAEVEQSKEDHKVTICHATGSATNPFVQITVDEHALKNGHTTAKGDIIPAPAGGCPTVAAQAPVVVTPQVTPQATPPAQQVAPTQVAPAQQVAPTQQAAPQTAAPAPATQSQPAGGVEAARTTLAKPKLHAHHGVLGTVTHVAGSSLPFTGFPVWLAVLIALALILAGIAIRRRGLGARV